MYYVFYIEVDENGIITKRHKSPFHPLNGMKKSVSELLKDGFLIDPYKEPDFVEGKRAVHMWDGSSVYFKYVDDKDNGSYQKELNEMRERIENQDRLLEELLFEIIPNLGGI